MSDEKSQTPVTANPGDDGRLPDPKECPNCRAPLERKMFRTGSVQHPGHDMLVCPQCGSKK